MLSLRKLALLLLVLGFIAGGVYLFLRTQKEEEPKGPSALSEDVVAGSLLIAPFEDDPWFAGMFLAGFYLTVFKDSIGTTNSLWYKQAETVFRYWYAGLVR